jgi:hypothetical protein
MASLNNIFTINQEVLDNDNELVLQDETEKKKVLLLLSTTANLLKNKLYTSISNIIGNLHETVYPCFSHTIFSIDLMLLLSIKSDDNSKLVNDFLFRNKALILDNDNCKTLFKLVFVLSYFKSVRESDYFKALQDELITSIVKVVDDAVNCNDIDKDIDLELFLSFYKEIVFLQSYYLLNFQNKSQSFDKFIEANQRLLCFKQEPTRNQLIHSLFTALNVEYEIEQIMNIPINIKNTSSKNKKIFNIGNQKKQAIIKEILSTNTFYNSSNYSKMMEIYSFNDFDKVQLVDFIIKSFKIFYSSEFKLISEMNKENLSSSDIQLIREIFNQDYLKRKDYYVNLFINHIKNDVKLEIKGFYFAQKYQDILEEVQELLIIV